MTQPKVQNIVDLMSLFKDLMVFFFFLQNIFSFETINIQI